MIPIIRNDIEIQIFDTSSETQKYLVKTNNSKQYEISSYIYHLIKLIDGKSTIEEIAFKFSLIIKREVTTKELNNIIKNYISKNGFLIDDKNNTSSLKKSSILNIRIQIFPKIIVDFFTSFLQYLFNKYAFGFNTISILILILYIISLTYSSISLNSFFTFDIILIYPIILLTTIFHEFGHTSACRYLGANHGGIGFGFYLYFPVFYAEVSDVWKLKRWKRAIVDVGGVYFQLLTIPLFFLLFILYKKYLFIKIIYLLLFSLVTTLNPFFRFDGYWLASDISGIPNLRENSLKMFIQIINKVFYRKRKVNIDFLNITTSAKIFLYCYAFLSNFFFLFYIIFLLISLPTSIQIFYQDIIAFINLFLDPLLTLKFDSFLSSFSKLIFPSIIIFVIIKMIINWTIKLYNFFKKSAESKNTI